MAKKYRTNIWLPTSLAEKFIKIGKVQGLTRTKLLNQWVDSHLNSSTTLPAEGNIAETTSFSVRLTTENWDKINQYKKASGYTKTHVIAGIIKIGIQKTTAQNANHYDFRMIQTEDEIGSISDISDVQIFTLAARSIRLGNLKKGIEYLYYLEQKLINKSVESQEYIKVYILRCIIARHQRDMRTAKRMGETALELARQYNCTESQILAANQLGIISEIEDRYDEALRYVYYCLAMTGDNDGQTKALQIRLLNLLAINQDSQAYVKELGKFYQKFEAQDLISQQRIALSKIRLGDYSSAIEIFAATDKNISSENITELRYNLENMGVINLMRGRNKLARLMLEQAGALEDQFRVHRDSKSRMSKNTLYSWFIESEDNFEYVHQTAQRILENNKSAVYKSLSEYVLASMCYLNGNNRQVKRRGELLLKRLADSSANVQVAYAAARTIQEKRIQAVV